MCELLALSSAKKIEFNPYLSEFARHGGLIEKHKDGWGLVSYAGKAIQISKETQAAHCSSLLPLLQLQLNSRLILAHVRLATQGKHSMANTQPFARELAGRMHTFIHNGDLTGIDTYQKNKNTRFMPVGESDSELAFCVLLNRLSSLWQQKKHPSIKQRHAVIEKFAHQIAKLGSANFIYSDSECLFVFSHKRQQKYCTGLHSPGLYCLSKAHGVIFSSVPLSQEDWQPLDAGTLLAIKNGQIKRQSR